MLRARAINLESNSLRFRIVLHLHLQRCSKEQVNMMLLQESEQVMKTLGVEQKLDLYKLHE